MVNYSKYYNARKTLQSQAIPGTTQMPNTAGGYAWHVDKWKKLHRFLILGTEGGTYYIGERELTVENANAVLECIKEDGERVVAETARVSVEGRAPKNEPALFVLAMCAGLGNPATRQKALYFLPQVARIGTHLFAFAEYIQAFRGWGRALRRAIGEWYTAKSPDALAYQLVKYQQRNGWSHRDLLRLSHPKPVISGQNALFEWVTQGVTDGTHMDLPANKATSLIYAFERAKVAEEKETINLIADFGLTREMVNNKHLNSAAVWEALLEKMPLHAMVRNLGNMSKVGLLTAGSDAQQKVVKELGDVENIHKSRLHPMSILIAAKTYESGRGYRGHGSWDVNAAVLDALDEAFYLAFDNVEDTGARILNAIDASGSMMAEISDVTNLSAREAAVAMSLVTPNVGTVYFTGHDNYGSLPITRKQRLADAMRALEQYVKGTSTDASLPFQWAIQNSVNVDAFIIYTDSETWQGERHPVQALRQYRDISGINAKMIVVAMVANQYSIADPNDAGQLDVVGFDTSVPQVIQEFVR